MRLTKTLRKFKKSPDHCKNFCIKLLISFSTHTSVKKELQT